MFKRIRAGVLMLAALVLTACGAAEPKWAPDAEVSRAFYHDSGPPTLTMFTVVNNQNGSGAHSSLMVSGSERAIFDPAGTFRHPRLPERNDVVFGMTDAAVVFYIDYHTRITYHTIVQEIQVSPEVAELALAQIKAYGAVPKAQCSKSVSSILRRLPGFGSIGVTWFPNKLSEEFGKLPGVTTRIERDFDPDDNSGVVTAYGI